MSDNTTLPNGSGGDTIRTVAKTANNPAKTQSVMVDIGGGADGSPETIWTAGAAAASAAAPVTPSNLAVGSAAIAASQAGSIGTSAASIVSARTGVSGTGRIAVTLLNMGSVTVYIGASGVTTSTGFPISPGAALTINTTAQVYGIVASSTGSLAVLETY